MAFVMLSRSQTMEDVFISGEIDLSQIKCNPAALEESERLYRAFMDRISHNKETRETQFIISFLNVNSLHAHEKDVSGDVDLMDSDVFALGETWLKPGEKVNFDGFNSVFENVRKGQGIAAYYKDNLKTTVPLQVSNDDFSAILLNIKEVCIIFLYLSSGFSWENLKDVLDTWIGNYDKVAILGDVNWNFLKKSHKMKTYLFRKNFQQIVKNETHDAGGLIDHIYVSSSLFEQNVLCETKCVYYSDHDIVQLKIPCQ